MKCWTLILLCAAAFCAETDPFVGKWEMDRAASQFEPQYEVIEALGNHRFRISEGPTREPSINSFTTDGREQPANFARTLSVKPQGENAWWAVWKMKNGDRDESTWAVSPDGKALTQMGTYSEHEGKKHHQTRMPGMMAQIACEAGIRKAASSPIAIANVGNLLSVSFASPAEPKSSTRAAPLP